MQQHRDSGEDFLPLGDSWRLRAHVLKRSKGPHNGHNPALGSNVLQHVSHNERDSRNVLIFSAQIYFS